MGIFSFGVGEVTKSGVTSANNMLNFSDLLVLAMALPNLIGLYMMQNVVHVNLKSYLDKWREGELDREAISYNQK